jgi:hypothetical protein
LDACGTTSAKFWVCDGELLLDDAAVFIVMAVP